MAGSFLLPEHVLQRLYSRLVSPFTQVRLYWDHGTKQQTYAEKE